MSPNVAAILLVIMTCFATHRVTRLITRDHLPLVAIPRTAIIQWLDPVMVIDGEPIKPTPKRPLGVVGWSVAFLLECDWCMSVWVAGALVAAEYWGFNLPVPYPLLLWAMASTITGLVANHEPDE